MGRFSFNCPIISLGFNGKCFGYYNKAGELTISECEKSPTGGVKTSSIVHIIDVISAPLLDQTQDWLEEKHGLGIETALDNTLSWVWRITPLHPEATHQEQIKSQFVYCKGRKEALIAAIEESLKLIPNEIL